MCIDCDRTRGAHIPHDVILWDMTDLTKPAIDDALVEYRAESFKLHANFQLRTLEGHGGFIPASLMY
jgi:hypothetical protein